MAGKRTISQADEPNQLSRLCFTLNNYVANDVDKMTSFAQDYCKYMVFGKEMAPETGTPHLQGFFILNRKKTRGALKKLFQTLLGRQPWFQAAQATSKQAADYCKKDGDIVEIGDCPREPGEAGGAAETDRWDLIYEAIDDCDTWDDFFTWLRTNMRPKEVCSKLSMFQNLYNLMRKKRVQKIIDDLECEWIWGPPGTGKSHVARAENEGNYYVKAPTGKFFDGYDGESCIIFDDLDPNSSRDVISLIKQVADKYAVIVEVKGASMLIRPKKVIITSNYTIDGIFTEPQIADAMKRRFAKIRHLTVRYVAPVGSPANPPVEDLTHTQEENDAGKEIANAPPIVVGGNAYTGVPDPTPFLFM